MFGVDHCLGESVSPLVIFSSVLGYLGHPSLCYRVLLHDTSEKYEFVGKCSWQLFVGKCSWQLFVVKCSWQLFVGKCSWQLFEGKCSWKWFVGKCSWQLFVGKCSWQLFVGKCSWKLFVGKCSWSSPDARLGSLHSDQSECSLSKSGANLSLGFTAVWQPHMRSLKHKIYQTQFRENWSFIKHTFHSLFIQNKMESNGPNQHWICFFGWLIIFPV